MFSNALKDDAQALLVAAENAGLTIAAAESCTGGLVTGLLTALPGSSAVVERGFVTYSNEAKTQMLGVPADTIAAVGAVSEEVCAAMLTGVLANSPADLAIAITGVAGPGGGSAEKPVGLVYVGVASRSGALDVTRNLFDGDREAVRVASIAKAIALLRGLIAA